MRYKITEKEFMLAIVFGILGFLFSMREWILFLDSLNPFQGLVVYYIILYVSLLILSKLGLIIYKFKIENPIQVFGALLITFSFFIIVDWESPYIQAITGRSYDTNAISQVYFQCEDGAVWWVYENIFKITDIGMLRILTYVITPFILSLIGALLISRKVELG